MEEISIEKESTRFYKFLNEKDNNNIIFSGAFGIGKSYFLNKFFNEKYQDEYIGIFLSPVNYSVATNEDIFEYIKVDILFQLMAKIPCDFSTSQISFNDAIWIYLKKNPTNFLLSLLQIAEKLYLETDIISTIKKIKDNIEQLTNKNNIDEKHEIYSFLEEYIDRTGSIYESNIITQIIYHLVEEAKNGKKIILVIDDLDRIDPEHIFRILNILSVHNDYANSKEHKFGFNKTILVCDIKNIRNIYHAKYGTNVDFNGYIDKFYSKEIFYFQNENEIIKNIYKQVCKMEIENELSITDPQEITHKIFVSILMSFIQINAINIRTLEKFEHDLSIGDIIINSPTNRFIMKTIWPIAIFEILEKIFCSPDDLDESLCKLANEKHPNYISSLYSQDFLHMFIALADYPNNGFVPNREGEYKLASGNNKIAYTITADGVSKINYNNIQLTPQDSFEILYNAYKNYKKFFSVRNKL